MPSLTTSTGFFKVRNSPMRVVPVRTIMATNSSRITIILAPVGPAASSRGWPSRPPITPPPVLALLWNRVAMYWPKPRSSGRSLPPKMYPVAQNSTMITTVSHTLPLMDPLGFSRAVITAT